MRTRKQNNVSDGLV